MKFSKSINLRAPGYIFVHFRMITVPKKELILTIIILNESKSTDSVPFSKNVWWFMDTGTVRKKDVGVL